MVCRYRDYSTDVIYLLMSLLLLAGACAQSSLLQAAAVHTCIC
jgi:hypothetical protein